MAPSIHHVPIEEADLRSEELLEAVAERGESVVFYRDGVPVVEMSPAHRTVPPASAPSQMPAKDRF